MPSNLIHDRGRGPEIVGTRITVYNLLPHFLDPAATESLICGLYHLTPEQVAAARAFVLNNPETVLARHLELEARMEAGNPTEVIERAKATQTAFRDFKDWLVKRQEAEVRENLVEATSTTGLPTFREWLSEQASRSGS